MKKKTSSKGRTATKSSDTIARSVCGAPVPYKAKRDPDGFIRLIAKKYGGVRFEFGEVIEDASAVFPISSMEKDLLAEYDTVNKLNKYISETVSEPGFTALIKERQLAALREAEFNLDTGIRFLTYHSRLVLPDGKIIIGALAAFNKSEADSGEPFNMLNMTISGFLKKLYSSDLSEEVKFQVVNALRAKEDLINSVRSGLDATEKYSVCNQYIRGIFSRLASEPIEDPSEISRLEFDKELRRRYKDRGTINRNRVISNMVKDGYTVFGDKNPETVRKNWDNWRKRRKLPSLRETK